MTYVFRRKRIGGRIVAVAILMAMSSPVHAEDGLTVEQLAELAAGAHPAVLARRALLGGAEARRSAARMGMLPSLSVSAEDAASGTLGDGRDNGMVVGLTQPLITGGRYGADNRVARAGVEVSRASVSETRQQVALAVADAWGATLAARERGVAYARGLERLGVLKERMDRRAAAGLSPEADRRLVDARIDQFMASLAQARGDERASAARLSELVGEVIEPLMLAAVGAPPAPVGETLEHSLDLALDASPGMRRLAGEERLAQGRTAQLRASAMPQLYARVEHERSLDRLFREGRDDTRVMFGVRFGLDNGWSILPRVAAARAEERAARDEREAARRDVSAQVATQAAALDATLRQMTALADNAGRLEAVAQSYERGFAAGTRSWLDLLNVVREETEASRQLAELKVQAAALSFRLNVLVGKFSWID